MARVSTGALVSCHRHRMMEIVVQSIVYLYAHLGVLNDDLSDLGPELGLGLSLFALCLDLGDLLVDANVVCIANVCRLALKQWLDKLLEIGMRCQGRVGGTDALKVGLVDVARLDAERAVEDVVADVERVDERDGVLADVGAQARDLERDRVHVLGLEVAVAQEEASMLLDLPQAIETADDRERLDDAVARVLRLGELLDAITELSAPP